MLHCLAGHGMVVVSMMLCAGNGMAATTGAGRLFFAMDTGTKDAEHAGIDAQMALLKELGYGGIGYTGCKDIPALIRASDRSGVAISTIYVSASISAQGHSCEDGLAEAAVLLRGRGTVIWLTISSAEYKPSDEAGDIQAVALVREVGDMAAASGLRVALYPHTATWLERVDDALRVVGKAKRGNAGVTFNLCHWLNAERGQNLGPLLEQALPHLFEVTINGADHEGGWDRLIQTLDRGAYDVRDFLGRLDRMGYKGPIGLQGYGIPGPVRENLIRSMAAWAAMNKP